MIFKALEQHAEQIPGDIALSSDAGSLTYAELWTRIEKTAAWLEAEKVRCLGIALDNGIDWVVLDLAAMKLRLAIVPVPGYFTPAQVDALVEKAGIDCLVTAGRPGDPPAADDGQYRAERFTAERRSPDNAKITFTSGSTGQPRGAILSHETLGRVAMSIVEAMTLIDVRRHLCMLPLATLLENVAGVYAPLIKGIETIVPSPEASGLAGSSSLDIEKFAACLANHQPQSLILVPQLLMALTTLAEFGMVDASGLRMVAVGGGKVGLNLLKKAETQGIPVFEGYGLSEAGSVTTLNLPGHSRPGSVGRALPHAELRVSDTGELEVRGTLMSGYLGEPPLSCDWLPTGDLGSIDKEGFVTVDGRIKNMFVTAYGRNINPEWVEAELTQHPSVGQALVVGEARATNLALIWPRFETSVEALQVIVDDANSRLPDYARVHDFLVMEEALDPSLMTANGRLKRQDVMNQYAARIAAHYETEDGLPFPEAASLA